MSNERNAGRKSKLNDEQMREVKTRHDAGESVSSLAKEFGISRQALTKKLSELEKPNETKVDYYVDGELVTSFTVNKKSQVLRLINYSLQLSNRPFGFSDNPSYKELQEFLQEYYLREKGVTDRSQFLMVDENRDIILPTEIEGAINEKEKLVFDNKNLIPIFTFSKSDRLINRTDTDGFQMKAITKDRKLFVKSQAIISGVIMKDWAVEVIAYDLCRQLGIPCVRQTACKFVYAGHSFDGVYSDNFEIDGFTFLSFESLLEKNSLSTKEEYYISLNTIDKLKWSAEKLSEYGAINHDEALKYMIDLAVIDCLVGNVDRHTRNFGLFFNSATGQFQIPLIFDNGMGLFENDYFRDNYDSFQQAMNNVYISPYGEDPFEMLMMLDKEFHLKRLYPKLAEITYLNLLSTPFALEYERRMQELCQKLDG